MNFKRYVEASDTWVDSHYIKKTDTDTITTLPAIIYPLAQTGTVGLKGNTTQSGTPTPDNPVPVIGVGDLDNGNYKIPILSTVQTTNVYLGEVQTTRKIKKLVLTGEERFTMSSSADNTFYRSYANLGINAIRDNGFCTHAMLTTSVTIITDGEFVMSSNGLYIRNNDYADASSFNSWLAAQYAAGTPVTVWYVLSSATTGIVNEPLMKIGDYADEVSGVSIPVTAGANTLSVDTTLQPSEVTVNYKGWHPVTDVHERESGAWT